MHQNHNKKLLQLWTPATYRISVQGILDERYIEQLDGVFTIMASFENDAPITTLHGCFRDQAALVGVLNTLYSGLRMPLLLVECIASREIDCDKFGQERAGGE